jgi:hypothetical protein
LLTTMWFSPPFSLTFWEPADLEGQ